MAVQEQFVSEETVSALAALVAEESLVEVMSRPGFPEASRKLAALWRAPANDEDKAFAHFMRDLGRFIGGMWALFLHVTPGGLTVTRLADLLASTKVTSASRARTILLYLQFIGYVAPTKATGDSRIKLYAPTPRLVDAFRSRLVGEFEAMGHMHPAIAETGRLFSEDGAFDIFAELMGEIFLAYMAIRKERPGPSLEMFSQRYAGMMMLGELMATAAPDDVFPPAGPMRHSIADLSRRCRISRTQVRKMLKDAETVGFLRLPEDGVAVATDLFREHVNLTNAGQVLGGLWSCERFLERMRQQR